MNSVDHRSIPAQLSAKLANAGARIAHLEAELAEHQSAPAVSEDGPYPWRSGRCVACGSVMHEEGQHCDWCPAERDELRVIQLSAAVVTSEKALRDRDAALAAAHEALREVVREWRDAYPLDIFPDPPRGTHGDPGTPVDLYAARMGRHMAKRIGEQIEEVFAKTDAADLAEELRLLRGLEQLDRFCGDTTQILEDLRRFRKEQGDQPKGRTP